MLSSRSSFRSSLLLAAALAGLGTSAAVMPDGAARAAIAGAPVRNRATQPIRSRTFGGASSSRRAAFGWTNRHAQRVAAKKRNVLRHRARSRGHA